MPVAALRSHADIAAALRTLGVSLDDARALDPKKASDPALARALVDVLAEVSPAEMKRLAAAVGAGGAPSSTAARATSGTSRAHVVARLPVKHGEEPRVDVNTPAVAVLLQRYGVADVAPRPLERVLAQCARIDEILRQSDDPDVLLEKIMAGDLRRYVFLLEGVAKLYGRRYDEADDTYVAAKALEDLLGDVSATRTNLAYARQVKAPADVVAHLEKKAEKTRRALRELLKDKWMPDKHGHGSLRSQVPAIREILRGWGRADWDGYVDDKKVIRKELVRRLVKLSDAKYSMTDLPNGIHELRRQLRWFPIYAEAVNGLIQLDVDKNPVAAYQPLLDVQLATSKYVDLPDDSREVDAIHISKSLYLGVIQLTLDLGGIKDAGEPLEELYAAYVETGHAEDLSAARDQVLALIGGDRLERDLHAAAEELYAGMRNNKLVEKLAEQVKKG